MAGAGDFSSSAEASQLTACCRTGRKLTRMGQSVQVREAVEV